MSEGKESIGSTFESPSGSKADGSEAPILVIAFRVDGLLSARQMLPASERLEPLRFLKVVYTHVAQVRLAPA